MTTDIKQATIDKFIIEVMPDEMPDLSYLDQFENSEEAEDQKCYLEDQKRKASYGETWVMIGIKAIAVILIPTSQGGFIMQRIESSGLWGIETDGEDRTYYSDVAMVQIDEIKEYLKILNVGIDDFEEKKVQTIKDFKY